MLVSVATYLLVSVEMGVVISNRDVIYCIEKRNKENAMLY